MTSTQDMKVTKPDGHQFSVYELLTDFCRTACPVCGSEHNDVQGAPMYRTNSEHGIRTAAVQIPMECAQGHEWYIRITTFVNETTFCFTTRRLA